MKAALIDQRGRIHLGAKTAEEYGRKFAIIRGKKEIVLMPIPKDPLAHLRMLFKEAGIDKYTIKQLRKMALEEAENEALKNVGRH